MKWMIPGTALVAETADGGQIEERFRAMFLPGGMVLSQVASVTGLEPYTIQNWVKRGFLSPPQKKRYSLSQLCRIVNINMLKSALSLEQICGLLTYINGELDDERDDLIDDSALYFLFLRLAGRFPDGHDGGQTDAYIRQMLEGYREPVPGARERVAGVLRVMLTAWSASQLRSQALEMLEQLQSPPAQ